VGSKKVTELYDLLVNTLGSEFDILMKTDLIDIKKLAGEKVAEAVSKVRSGDIYIEPGYDGVFGTVKIWKDKDDVPLHAETDQASLF
jgi:PHP family Zn ribbon phosphoesterase